MKRKYAPRRGLLLTPLIDVIFLVTLFFVINTSFRPELYIEVDLPESISAQGNEGGDIIITLLSTGVTRLNGRNVSMDSLTEAIMLAMEESGGSEVVIRGDKSVPYEFAVSVLDRVRLAGSNAVSLQTLGAER